MLKWRSPICKKQGWPRTEAKISFDRVKQLFDRNLDSQADYDAASATYESAMSDVKTAQTGLDQTHINLNYANNQGPD